MDILAEPNSIIRVSYDGIIEAGFDFVTVYDGTDADARRYAVPILNIWGRGKATRQSRRRAMINGAHHLTIRIGISTNYTVPFTVDSSGPDMYFTFFSDKRTQLFGWSMTYQIMSNCTN